MAFGSKACMIFSYLNCICAFFIGWLFELQINSFSIPTVKHQWDKTEKAKACRHAAIMYLFLAVFMTFKSWWEDKKAAREGARATPWHERILDLDAHEEDPDTAPLLPSPDNGQSPRASRGLRGGHQDGEGGVAVARASRQRNYGSAL